MRCGLQREALILRLGPEGAAEALASRRARPMDFTGRALTGFVTVHTAALGGRALAEWLPEAVAWADSLPPKQRQRRTR